MTDQQACCFNTPGAEEPRWIPIPKRVRVDYGKKTVADSRRTRLLRSRPPVYYFPEEDVQRDALVPSEHTIQEEGLGRASFWHVRANSRQTEDAAWQIREPHKEAPEGIESYIAFEWKAMDAWWEEEEQVRVHPRDPFSRIDCLHSSREIRVEINGVTAAETSRAVLLFETGLPVRYYFPKQDLNLGCFEPADLITRCPYKGKAHYYSAVINGEKHENIAWTYPYPNPNLAKIQDRVAFYTEKLDGVFVDGQQLPAGS
jgi:uncharacterized protein (DUF427 family)